MEAEALKRRVAAYPVHAEMAPLTVMEVGRLQETAGCTSRVDL